MKIRLNLIAECDEEDADLMKTATAIKNNRLVDADGNEIIKLIYARKFPDRELKEKASIWSKDGDILNLSRSNMYLQSSALKNWNRLSKYNGVTIQRTRKYERYTAQFIESETKKRHYKTFKVTPENEIKAAKAYDDFVRQYHGNIKKLNFPTDEERELMKNK